MNIFPITLSPSSRYFAAKKTLADLRDQARARDPKAALPRMTTEEAEQAAQCQRTIRDLAAVMGDDRERSFLIQTFRENHLSFDERAPIATLRTILALLRHAQKAAA